MEKSPIESQSRRWVVRFSSQRVKLLLFYDQLIKGADPEYVRACVCSFSLGQGQTRKTHPPKWVAEKSFPYANYAHAKHVITLQQKKRRKKRKKKHFVGVCVCVCVRVNKKGRITEWQLRERSSEAFFCVRATPPSGPSTQAVPLGNG